MKKRKIKSSEVSVFRLGMEMDKRFLEADSKAQQYRDQILTGQDKIVKELQDMREENAAGLLQYRRISSTLEDHERRIKTLEHRKN